MLSIKVALGGVYNYYSENGGGGSRPVRPKMGGVSMWYPTGADLRYPPLGMFMGPSLRTFENLHLITPPITHTHTLGRIFVQLINVSFLG